MVHLPRDRLKAQIEQRLAHSPIAILLGPRQCGKTTLAREIAQGHSPVHFFDVERPADQQRLREPMTALEPLKGLVIIDEAQLRPDLFPILRVLADREKTPARFLLSGSASPELVRNSSESLAGRAALFYISGFNVYETGSDAFRTLWLRGGFPRAYLAPTEAESFAWRGDFIQLFLERDLRNLGVGVPPATMHRLWTMLSHYHGQVGNSSELGRSLGEAHTTVRRHLDILAGAFMVRQLQPWFENAGKRVVKSPKVYIRDSGLLHALLGIHDFTALESHPKLGASWEGFVIEQLLSVIGEKNAYFWGTQSGAELDLFFLRGSKRFGVEVKYADAPKLTRSIHTVLADLRLDQLWIIYPGRDRYTLADRVTVLPLANLEEVAGQS